MPEHHQSNPTNEPTRPDDRLNRVGPVKCPTFQRTPISVVNALDLLPKMDETEGVRV